MNAYGYTAFTNAGKRRNGTIIAETESHAAAQLQEQGLYVSHLELRDSGGGWRAAFSGQRTARLSPDLQAVFTRQMAVLLGAELPVEAALEAVREGGQGTLDTVAARARASLMDGAPLSEALAQSGAGFAPYFTAAVHAGETAGDLPTVFEALAEFLETRGTDRAQITSALIYPGFVAAVSLLVCGILMVSVAPEIVAMFEVTGRPLPTITQNVLAVSDWIQRNVLGLSVVIVVILCLIFAARIVHPLRTKRDRLLLQMPLIGRFMRLAAAVQYLRTLALILGAKHSVLSAAENAARVLTIDRFRAEADAVCVAIRQGETLSKALDRLSIIPSVARQLIRAGEASVRLARMTDRSAVLVENGLSIERKRLAALLEPVLMMVVGGFVLIIVLSVLLPIFDLQAVVAS
ncbi:type II secretion system F family protein [Tateyamaria omphalii]|uniref:General secretion pathway protein GspF n=1 Tax=Tateyamaria omphalii TaxID=299262 RepID=A0A1P8N1V3_9RHOB|nr:type II secretion system F family protein [Tateyamaria omphalii]APX14291.1 general secretion pathway protein GspF [Tateyamaria omphalii]